MLKTICYKSKVKSSLSILELESLFSETLANNNTTNITGVLVIRDAMFFQIIEGNAEIIDAIFLKIKKDTRHSKIIEFINKPISRLNFKAFDTGYAVIQDVDALYGLQEYIADLGKNKFENSVLFSQIIEDLLTID